MEASIRKNKEQALGKGLSTLLPGGTNSRNYPNSKTGEKVYNIEVDNILPGDVQPREHFDEAKLQELAQSIKDNGVLQPIIVRPEKSSVSKYRIIAGERRWRASKLAQRSFVPVIVKDVSDKQALEIAVIENIQRQSLSPIEEGEAYKKLMNNHSYTQEQLAENLGKSRSHITNIIRLLDLPEKVRKMVHLGNLSMGHGRALIGVKNSEKLANKIVAKNLSVREIEKIKAKMSNNNKKRTAAQDEGANLQESSINMQIQELEQLIQQRLNLKVKINFPGKNSKTKKKGCVSIYFNEYKDLDVIVRKIT